MTGTPGSGAPAAAAAGPPGTAGPDLRDVAQEWPVVGDPRRAGGVFVTLRTDRVRMPDGEVVSRDVVEHRGAVAVVALNEAEQVLLIRQYRHPAGGLLWEIPAGVCDVAGEPPHVTAQRELLEEAGYTARDWHVLGDLFTSPGVSTERIRVFLARGLTWVPPAARDYQPHHEEAHLLAAWVPLAQAVGHFLAGDLHNGVAAMGILSAYAARESGFAGLRAAGASDS